MPMVAAEITSSPFEIPPLENVAKIIADSSAPIQLRMKALFFARHHGGDDAVKALCGAIGDKSVLLVHEAAYVIGQLALQSGVEPLVNLLKDTSQHSMVRHEAAEALAAIGNADVLDLLRSYLSDPDPPVRETCELACVSLEKKMVKSQITSEKDETEGSTGLARFYLFGGSEESKFKTIDPVAGVGRVRCLSTQEQRSILLDEKENLYRRYEALFALRDSETPDAIRSLNESLLHDKSSALLRHELAFVLGQLQSVSSIEALRTCLANKDEHAMARHEAALGLGGVGCGEAASATNAIPDIVASLKKFSEDPDPIVAESCLVALDNIKDEYPAIAVS